MTRWTAAMLLAATALTGCGGSDGPEMYAVSGTVTFDGKPIETGRVLFRLVERDQKAFTAEITNGEYALKTEPGKMTVEIIASRLIPGKFDNSNGTPEPVGEMYIPRKYNSASTLTAEVKTDGENQIPFDLTSK